MAHSSQCLGLCPVHRGLIAMGGSSGDRLGSEHGGWPRFRAVGGTSNHELPPQTLDPCRRECFWLDAKSPSNSSKPRLLPICRPVSSDPMTAGLRLTSNGETKAQRGMIDEVPEIQGVLGNFDCHGLQTAPPPLASNTTKARNLASISVAEVIG